MPDTWPLGTLTAAKHSKNSTQHAVLEELVLNNPEGLLGLHSVQGATEVK
jgi:hypothetical protein